MRVLLIDQETSLLSQSVSTPLRKQEMTKPTKPQVTIAAKSTKINCADVAWRRQVLRHELLDRYRRGIDRHRARYNGNFITLSKKQKEEWFKLALNKNTWKDLYKDPKFQAWGTPFLKWLQQDRALDTLTDEQVLKQYEARQKAIRRKLEEEQS